jgi:NAD(P)H-hydrate epimerase
MPTMDSLPASVIPCDEVALVDAAILREGELEPLMERAGAALAARAIALAPSGALLVAVGPGNNGGDGLVAARLLAEAGRSVSVLAIGGPPRTALAQQQWQRLPASIARLAAPPTTAPALWIDAVLGAGRRGPLRDELLQVLSVLARLSAPCLAADRVTGQGHPECVPKQVETLCFGLAKQEVVDSPASGRVSVADIGLAERHWAEITPVCLQRFPRHDPDGHKGRHGELLIIGGGPFPGALELACRAAVRSGCDLVRSWTTDGPPLPPTVVVHRQEGPALAPGDADALAALLVRAKAVLIGPGLGRQISAVDAARQAFALAVDLGVPVVVDADGIDACAAQIREHPADENVPLLLTPHGGERQNLLGRGSGWAAVHAFARPNRVVLAKGRVDLVSDGRRWQRHHGGNPRMTVGGTGDVLAGLAAGLLARGCTPFDAARLAVWWTCAAADGLWASDGPCYDALDVIAALPATLRMGLQSQGRWPPI